MALAFNLDVINGYIILSYNLLGQYINIFLCILGKGKDYLFPLVLSSFLVLFYGEALCAYESEMKENMLQEISLFTYFKA